MSLNWVVLRIYFCSQAFLVHSLSIPWHECLHHPDTFLHGNAGSQGGTHNVPILTFAAGTEQRLDSLPALRGTQRDGGGGGVLHLKRHTVKTSKCSQSRLPHLKKHCVNYKHCFQNPKKKQMKRNRRSSEKLSEVSKITQQASCLLTGPSGKACWVGNHRTGKSPNHPPLSPPIHPAEIQYTGWQRKPLWGRWL